MKLPEEIAMLVSFVNMKLRDGYDSPESLCEDLSVSCEELKERLLAAGYVYREEQNAFRPL